jgi:hypothetical protein
MIRIFTILFGVLVFLVSCGESGSEGKENINTDSLDKVKAEEEKIKQAAEQVDKVKTALDKMTPLSQEELKALLPATLSGGSQENGEVENNAGVNIASADYAVNDSTKITLTIFDCAGSAGAGIYNQQYLSLAGSLKDSEDEYTKEISVSGQKGYEYCDKVELDCVVSWFAAGRYLVTLEGSNVALLKKAANEIRIK